MKPPPRFAIGAQAIVGGRARLTGAELHHLRNVMRLAAGAEVILLSGDGTEYTGRVAGFEPDAAIVTIGEANDTDREPVRLILAAALIKGPRMDFLVEKSAELGAAELWPLLCTRCQVRDPGSARLERWQRLALAAAKQSLSPHMMKIRSVRSIADIIPDVPKRALALTCVQDAEPVAAVIRRTAPSALLVACGPEGGFVPDELAAMDAAGFVAAGLGTSRLRSETAALAALSIATGVLDELRGRVDGGS
ncbi:MAG TPA: RsmE family RNA methyltransferase [Candidatus Binataceae bacterium]|nr:RsmE family RNA methyltransferase [Candidatus Binataceae bacterium]